MVSQRIFTLEEVKKLYNGDVVYLKKWRNLKNGARSFTTKENCIVAGQNEEWISFRNLSSSYKDCKLEEYGKTWRLEAPKNSWERT